MASPNRTKLIGYAVAAVLVVWIGGCVVKRVSPVLTKWSLKSQIHKIEPWPATANYSAAAFRQLLNAANKLKSTESRLAAEAMEDDLRSCAGDPARLATEQGRIFLLLRACYDLPEHAAASDVRSFDGWPRDKSATNADGTVNLAWPLSFEGGKPRLVAGCPGPPTGNYAVKNEFSVLRFQYKPRDFEKLRTGD